jgi:hypothetical protein
MDGGDMAGITQVRTPTSFIRQSNNDVDQVFITNTAPVPPDPEAIGQLLRQESPVGPAANGRMRVSLAGSDDLSYG